VQQLRRDAWRPRVPLNVSSEQGPPCSHAARVLLQSASPSKNRLSPLRPATANHSGKLSRWPSEPIRSNLRKMKYPVERRRTFAERLESQSAPRALSRHNALSRFVCLPAKMSLIRDKPLRASARRNWIRPFAVYLENPSWCACRQKECPVRTHSILPLLATLAIGMVVRPYDPRSIPRLVETVSTCSMPTLPWLTQQVIARCASLDDANCRKSG